MLPGMKRPLSAAIALAATLGTTHADLRLPSFFTDHAVLQRDQPLRIWGWSSQGETIRVSLGSETSTATAGPDGRWIATLAPQPLSTKPLTLTISSPTETLSRTDILLGDVWLCSGQSNMDWSLGACKAPEDAASANFPTIRHFRTEYHFASTPQHDVRGQWQTCSPTTAHSFSAAGFYFARRIQSATGVPIGLITNAVGGTNIELWMSQETLLNTPSLEPYARTMRDSLAQHQRDLAAALAPMQSWIDQARAAQSAATPIPLPPSFPEFPFGEKAHRPRCTTLHNGHVAPLIPMSLRGVLWYQGENNADASLYLEKKTAMITAWRSWFQNPEMPFYFVQLAAWQKPNPDPAGGEWGPIRDAQRQCLQIPHTGMACAIDIGDAEDIHPANKADVGERLALWALARNYGKTDLTVSGPLFRQLTIEGQTARIHFDHTDTGLITATKSGRLPATETKGARLERFAIAGNDRQWHWADATIDGHTVTVSSPQVPAPVAVRYAFSSNPAGANLYNRAGLPASPFRTDSW
jgi:sialate O-acetylesterase